jgi:hypothetical protein
LKKKEIESDIFAFDSSVLFTKKRMVFPLSMRSSPSRRLLFRAAGRARAAFFFN